VSLQPRPLFFLPLCTRAHGRGILRTSPRRGFLRSSSAGACVGPGSVPPIGTEKSRFWPRSGTAGPREGLSTEVPIEGRGAFSEAGGDP